MLLNQIIKTYNIVGIMPMRKGYESYLTVLDLVKEYQLQTELTEKDYQIVIANDKPFIKITNWKTQHQLDKEIDIIGYRKCIEYRVQKIEQCLNGRKKPLKKYAYYCWQQLDRINLYNQKLIKLGAEPIKTKWTA